MAGAQILITWVSESGAAIRDMSRVSRALGDSASKADKWGRRMETASTVAQGALVGLAAAAWQVTLKASDQEQAIGSLEAVFKDLSPEIKKAADAAWEFGLSTTDYSQMAAVMGAQLKNLGLDSAAAADSTQELISLGGDLAAQFGGTTKSAVEALGSALRGEFDPVEQFGISLNEAAIKAKMAEGDFTKVEAVLELINEQAKKSGALGAAGREAETFASGMEQVKASFENVNASIGNALGGGKKGGALGDLARALNDLSDWIDENPDTFQKIAVGITAVTTALASLKAVSAVIGVIKSVNVGLGRLVPLLSSPFALATGYVAFDMWLDKMSDKEGGLWTVATWIKDIAETLANPTRIFAITLETWIDKLIDWVPWLERAARALGVIGGEPITGLGVGNVGVGGTPASRSSLSAPTLQSSQVGRLQAQPVGASVAVFVDGQRRPARVVTPEFVPAVAGLGMI